tara:strand:+ start:669 stop:818 length:150 start_codon:yes stop_codon:yes gene_type:complete
MSYKISSGFLNTDGSFQEDVQVIIHSECANDYSFEPFSHIEKKLKDGDI